MASTIINQIIKDEKNNYDWNFMQDCLASFGKLLGFELQDGSFCFASRFDISIKDFARMFFCVKEHGEMAIFAVFWEIISDHIRCKVDKYLKHHTMEFFTLTQKEKEILIRHLFYYFSSLIQKKINSYSGSSDRMKNIQKNASDFFAKISSKNYDDSETSALFKLVILEFILNRLY